MEIPDQFASLELNRRMDFEILEFHKASPEHFTPLTKGSLTQGLCYIHAPSKNEKEKSQGQEGYSAPRERSAIVLARASANCEGFSDRRSEFESCGNEPSTRKRDSAKTG
jgi:hypothetical protein